VTTTGIVGFTTGTGSGWLERKCGFAADNVLRADVVTAEGEIVTASEDENQELLWGLKGGGGNFGVVTEMEFKLSPLPPIVYGGLAAFPPEIMLNGGGAIGRVGENDTAISGRKAPFNFHLNGMWEDPAATDENIAWVKGVSKALAPHIAEGISLNFATEVGDEALKESFGAKKVERLRALKGRYDPTNFFRFNQNIAPSN
jgi:FAD/FMN-containing dehydrogenase